MTRFAKSQLWITTLRALVIGAGGAGLGYLLSFPIYVITGPALLVALAGVAGVRLYIHPIVREASFLIIGIGIGAGVDAQARAAFMSWPIAFVVLGVVLVLTLWLCRLVLEWRFAFAPRTALLAGSPGHLSYVLSLGTQLDLDIPSISLVQSIRLLALTLLVPMVATGLGMDLSQPLMALPQLMPPVHAVTIVILAAAIGRGLSLFRVPAGMLLGGMGVSALAHVTDVTVGGLPQGIMLPCFVVVGTIIGARFSGVRLADLRKLAMAGIAATLVAIVLAGIAALIVAPLVQMPVSHVLVAFAPGGLETMIAMGGVLGANPGFVAACHVWRLFMLTFMVPAALARIKG